MITVVMPEWQRSVYRFAPWLCLLIFLMFSVLIGRPLLANVAVSRKVMIGMTIFFLAPTIWGMATMTWFQRRIIAECIYDGCTLQFSTVGRPEPEMRPILELSQIEEWRQEGRFSAGGLLGYRLTFRDSSGRKQKLYVQLSLPSAGELVRRLEADRWPDHASWL
jgi:hypothetical protein